MPANVAGPEMAPHWRAQERDSNQDGREEFAVLDLQQHARAVRQQLCPVVPLDHSDSRGDAGAKPRHSINPSEITTRMLAGLDALVGISNRC